MIKKSKIKQAQTKSVTDNIGPLKEKLSKTEQYGFLVETASEIAGHEIAIKDVKAVITALDEMIVASVMPNSIGELSLMSMFKIIAKKVPKKKMAAIKKGTMVRNPRTGESMKSAGREAFTKPAFIRPKIRALSRLKKAVNGN
jgi:hypothetical protein